MATDETREPGMSRNKRGVYLRIPVVLYEKLMRLVASQIGKGDRASVNSVVCELIETAEEPRKRHGT